MQMWNILRACLALSFFPVSFFNGKMESENMFGYSVSVFINNFHYFWKKRKEKNFHFLFFFFSAIPSAHVELSLILGPIIGPILTSFSSAALVNV